MNFKTHLLPFTGLILGSLVPASAQYIVHVAGNDSPSVFNASRGDGTPAVTATVTPWNACTDAAGNIYVADEDANNWQGYIRKIAAGTGIVTTIGGGGYSLGDNIPATEEHLWEVNDVYVDIDSNLLVADGSGMVRKIDLATDIITTIAGGGPTLQTGDGGPATAAYMGDVSSISEDAAGNIYITDIQYNVVRKVTRSTGIITTVAGIDSSVGFSGYSGDGGPATAALLNGPMSVFSDAAGNLYISDASNNAIRRVDAATGIIRTVAGIPNGGYYSGDNIPATDAALSYPMSTVVDQSGNLFIADMGNNLVRRVDAVTGIITTYAGDRYGYGTGSGHLSCHQVGDGGHATDAHLQPRGLRLDPCGNLLISDGFWLRSVTKSFPYSGTQCGYPVSFDTEPEGVAPLAAHGAVKVSPNPNNGEFNIQFSATADAPVQVIITDILGKQIKEIATTTNHETEITLDAPAGIYIINAITPWGRQTSKIVVQ